ncbi:MAG TPA: hypothetical protein V6C95_15410 [Coleofasciculaceae cyanobacterium]
MYNTTDHQRSQRSQASLQLTTDNIPTSGAIAANKLAWCASRKHMRRALPHSIYQSVGVRRRRVGRLTSLPQSGSEKVNMSDGCKFSQL